jgi:hypothetical protein
MELDNTRWIDQRYSEMDLTVRFGAPVDERGHTSPLITFPIGGWAELDLACSEPRITLSW